MPTAGTSAPTLLFRCDLSRRALPFKSIKTFMWLALVWLALPGAGFVVAGAWPVMGFLGFEFLLLGTAFWIYRRRAGCRDVLQVSETQLVLRRVDGAGRTMAELRLPPHWVRVENIEPEGGPRGTQGHILIQSHGHSYRLGDYLTFAEREELVRELSAALAQTRV